MDLFVVGLSMVLDHTKDGCFYFKYDHNKEYRQVQFLFWDAVSSLNPENIVVSTRSYTSEQYPGLINIFFRAL